MRGVNASGAAAIEANEEAGAVGPIAEEPIGIYRYDKRLEDGSAIPAMVDVFPLEVAELHDHWQEMDERTRKWVTPAEAAEMVDEPDLQAILRAFRP